MKFQHFVLVVLSVLLLGSCSYKKLLYLQKMELPNEVSEYLKTDSTYRLRQNDILHIRVKSFDTEINDIFNSIGGTNTNNSMGMGGANSNGNSYFMEGYMIDDSGSIALPLIGKIKIQGLSIYEASYLIQKKFDEKFKDITLTIRLVSNKITFLGEVNNQGTKTFMQNELNLYEALAGAGGVTDYGNREKVLLVRPINDKFITYRVDLTNRKLLEKKELWLHPNDIVYVEPRKAKIFRISYTDYAFLISTITSLITTVLFITKIK